MFTKILIIAVMIAILVALGSSLKFLIQDEGKSTRMVKALSIRIGLSVLLFCFLLLAFAMGWIHPH